MPAVCCGKAWHEVPSTLRGMGCGWAQAWVCSTRNAIGRIAKAGRSGLASAPRIRAISRASGQVVGHPMSNWHCAGLGAAAVALLAATPAAAQSTSGLLGDKWQVGGLVYVSPSFEGSKSYEAIAFPFVAPAGLGSDGVVQIRGADDVRLRLFQAGGFELGPLAGYRFGRDGDDVSNVAG